ncbi:MAG: cysteine peptidase family C39 domain-containing protein [Patescibacteria group bacterium]|nr:cysteine peptidase family C39 domain-containing protein [Patescibacteria group bacterium]
MAYRKYHTIILPARLSVQKRSYDCGPVSLKIILETLGQKTDEKKLMKLCQAEPKYGSQQINLSRALKKLNIKHEVFENANLKLLEQKIRHFNLCLVEYQTRGKSGKDYRELLVAHFSVIFGFDETHYYLADPDKYKGGQKGFRTIRKDIFLKNWIGIKNKQGDVLRRGMIAVPLVSKPLIKEVKRV